VPGWATGGCAFVRVAALEAGTAFLAIALVFSTYLRSRILGINLFVDNSFFPFPPAKLFLLRLAAGGR